MPKSAATTDPATTPRTGAHRRSAPVDFSAKPTTTRTVARAVSGAAADGLPSGTSLSMSKTTGITVTAISRSTVPETVGVRTRRNIASRADSRS